MRDTKELWNKIKCVLGGCSPVDPSLHPDIAETVARIYKRLRPMFEQDVEEQTSTDQAASSNSSAGDSRFAPSAPKGEESGVTLFIRGLKGGNEFLAPSLFFDVLREALFASAGLIETDGGKVRFSFYNGDTQRNELYYCDSECEFHCESTEVEVRPNCEDSGVKSDLDFILSMKCDDPLMQEPAMKPFRAWVAWHPENGKYDIALSRASCEQRLTGIKRSDEQKYEEYIANHEAELAAHVESGWRVIEVEVRSVREVEK